MDKWSQALVVERSSSGGVGIAGGEKYYSNKFVW